MRIRAGFAGAFAVLILLAAYLGLAPDQIPSYYTHSDKVLHFVTFFLLSITFYWIFETSRRRVLHLTVLTCTAAGGVGSEFLQSFLPNGRVFDLLDIAANVLGSVLAIALCAWYHRRMIDRKRAAKGYSTVGGDEEAALEGVELQEGSGVLETGVTAAAPREIDIDAELEHWDENEADASDWDESPPKDGEAGGDPAQDLKIDA